MPLLKRVLESPLTLLLLVIATSCAHTPLLAGDVSDVTPSFSMGSLLLPALMLGIGIALILVELFVIPGFGVVGITGVALSVAGLFMGSHAMIVGGGHFSDFMGYLVSASITVVASTLLGCFFFWALPRVPGFRSMLPKEAPVGAKHGEGLPHLHHLSGQPGIASTDLRPAGKITLENGQVVDVVTRGEFIEAGTQVYVAKIDGPSVVVTKLV